MSRALADTIALTELKKQQARSQDSPFSAQINRIGLRHSPRRYKWEEVCTFETVYLRISKLAGLIAAVHTTQVFAPCGWNNFIDHACPQKGEVLRTNIKCVPGYSGHIPHARFMSGRTFGKIYDRASRKETKHLVASEDIPAAPQSKRIIFRVSGGTQPFQGSIPVIMPSCNTIGYTGHLPGSKFKFVL